MKKRFLVIAALIGLLVTCSDPFSGNPDDIDNPEPNPNPVPNQSTVIVFDNTQGICTAVVYENYQRLPEDKIAEVPAGKSSPEIEWPPGTSVPFYFSYRVNLKGINGFTLNYTPREVGKDQKAVRIDANTKTNIVIPRLEETLSSPDDLLSNSSYLLIQNNSSFSIELLRGDSAIRPDDRDDQSNTLINSWDMAQYTINAGAASNYRLLVGADYVNFSGSLVSFEAGCLYSFVFNSGNISLVSEVEIKLENVASVSPNKPVPEAPGAPVITASDRLLTVRWTAVEDAEKYEVYISTMQNPSALPERTIPGTVTVLTGLINKTAYYVWVKAVNENGASDFSPRSRGIPWPSNEVPATPGRPSIIPGVNQLTVTWEETGGASSYEVYVNTTTTPSSVAVTTDRTSAVITNLQNDVIYYVWVCAVNNSGKSGLSPVEAGTPKTPTAAPTAPPRPALSAGNKKLTVSWQAVELAASYEVWFGTSSNSAQAQQFGGDITGGVTETIITGLTNETTYYVWIKAKNVVGTSGFSLPANARPSAFAVLPETPALPTVIVGSRELTVNWQAIEGALSYEVWTGATNNSAYAEKYGADITGTSVTLHNLGNGTTYYIWIKAKNNIGASDFSPRASGTPSASAVTPPDPQSAPTVTTGYGQLSISWQAVEGASSYEIWAGTTINPTTASKRGSDVTSTSATITGLTNGTTYYVWIKAKNSVGTSGFSPIASGTPSSFSVTPQAPLSPAVSIGNGQITVTWTAVEGAMVYEIWMGTTNNSASAVKNGDDESVSLSRTISGLTNGTTYYVWIKAKNSAGTSGFSPTASGKPIGSATVPTLTSSNGQLSVTWAAITGADQYEVFYSTGVNPPQTASQTVNAASVTITGLTNGTIYNVWVRGKNSTGNGAMSLPVSAKPIGNMGTVTLVSGNGQLSLSWNSVAGADEYEVYHNTNNSIPASPAHTVTVTTATISSLTNGTTYYIWVKPKNANGTGGTSTVVSGVPMAVSNELNISAANQQITVSWDAVPGATSYEVYRSTSTTIPNSPSATVTTLSHTSTSLSNGTTYYFWIKAVNANGTGEASPMASGRPVGNMGTVTLVSGNGQLSASWSTVAGADQYEVYHSTSNSIPTNPAQTVTTTTTTITGLTNGTTYYVWVKPRNTNGAGSTSAVSGKPIANMGAVTLATGGSGELVLSWSAAAGADQYEVYHSTTNTIPASPAQTVSSTAATITGLTNGTTYYVWVRPKNANGTGGTSTAVSGVPMSPPGNLTVSAANQQITVSWNSVTNAASYDIYYSQSATIPASPSFTVTETSRTITGLTNGTTYYFWVKAVNAGGTSAASPMASGKPVGNMGTVTLNLGNNQLSLSWSAVAGADQYEIYHNTGNTIPATLTQTVSTTTATLTGLTNGTTYYVWVKPRNANGTGGTSTAVSGIPMAAPGALTVSAGNQQITVSWATVPGATSYQVFRNTGTTIPASPSDTVTTLSHTSTGLTNGTTYNFWVKAVNASWTSAASPMASGKPVGNMGTVTVSTGDTSGQLVLSWSSVPGADEYEVYRSTTNTIPGTPSQTVTITTATMTGLTNGTTYYVWVKPKNANGTGGTSTVVSGIPIAAPGTLTVSADNQQITVSWATVPGAASYQVYRSTSATIPASPSATVTTLNHTSTGLTNGTTYYFWVKAVNANGTGNASPMASGKPSRAGLYRGSTSDSNKIGNQNLTASLSYLSSNAVSGDNYFIIIGNDESVSNFTLNYSGKIIGITLIGEDREQKITLNTNGSMFTINTGVTLTLDENITLIGRNANDNALVYLPNNNNGKLIINDGAIISGNTSSNYGGGIYVISGTVIMNGGIISGNTNSSISGGGICVSGSGTFTMNGGTISGNNGYYGGGIDVTNGGTVILYDGIIIGNTSIGGGGISNSGGTVTMNGGTIRGNTVTGNSSNGGGIYVSGSGTFTMNGGTISGNTSTGSGGGIYVGNGSFIMHGGTISGNTVTGSSNFGGGIYVYNGTFKKLPSGDGGQNSGIIYGSEAVGNDANGVSLRNTVLGASDFYGHAVYFSSTQKRNTTAGQTDQIDTSTGLGLSANGNAPYGQ